MDPAAPKICVFCDQDCSRRPRSKDTKGRYMCHECLEKRKLKTGDYRPAMTRVVVLDRVKARTTQISLPGVDTSTGDPNHTVIGADSPEAMGADAARTRPQAPPVMPARAPAAPDPAPTHPAPRVQ